MYDRDGTLSQDFLRVSYRKGSETIFEIGVTLISFRLVWIASEWTIH